MEGTASAKPWRVGGGMLCQVKEQQGGHVAAYGAYEISGGLDHGVLGGPPEGTDFFLPVLGSL